MGKRGGEGKKKVNSNNGEREREREKRKKIKRRKRFLNLCCNWFGISTKGVWFCVVHVTTDLTDKNYTARAVTPFRPSGLLQLPDFSSDFDG